MTQEHARKTDPGSKRARRASRCLAKTAAVLGALICAGAAATLQAATGDDPTPAYRPGGLLPSEVGPALAYRSEGVETCAALSGSESLRAGQAGTGPTIRVLKILTRSPTARAIMESAAVTRVRGLPLHVCLDRETDLLAYYFSGLGVIGLNAALSEGGRVAFLAHEIAHVPQHPRYSDNRYYPPEDLLLLRRVREATAEAIAVRITWELRAAGYAQAWNEKASGPYADVARAFEVLARRGGGEAGLLAATRAAFDRWFAAAWRRDAYDRMTVDHLRRISGDHLGLVPPRRRLGAYFLRGIARVNGRNFLSETEGPPLNDPLYAGRVSSENAVTLRQVLQDAQAMSPAGRADPMDGAAY